MTTSSNSHSHEQYRKPQHIPATQPARRYYRRQQQRSRREALRDRWLAGGACARAQRRSSTVAAVELQARPLAVRTPQTRKRMDILSAAGRKGRARQIHRATTTEQPRRFLSVSVERWYDGTVDRFRIFSTVPVSSVQPQGRGPHAVRPATRQPIVQHQRQEPNRRLVPMPTKTSASMQHSCHFLVLIFTRRPLPGCPVSQSDRVALPRPMTTFILSYPCTYSRERTLPHVARGCASGVYKRSVEPQDVGERMRMYGAQIQQHLRSSSPSPRDKERSSDDPAQIQAHAS